MAKFDCRYITIGILRLVQSYDVILLKYYSQNILHGIKRKLRIQSKTSIYFAEWMVIINGNNRKETLSFETSFLHIRCVLNALKEEKLLHGGNFDPNWFLN